MNVKISVAMAEAVIALTAFWGNWPFRFNFYNRRRNRHYRDYDVYI